ncbi:MAG: MerR family transcriptional regulator [Acidimicrobiales bacterium]
MSSRTYLSIGDVLTLLREEFPDVTISKIRFLESQGLVNPERSPSGYRKFFDHDVERLRWVLRQQREHFLPLKVIRDRLADGDLGDDVGAERPNGKAAQPAHAVAVAGVASGHAHEQPTKADEEAMARILADASRRAARLPEEKQAKPGLQVVAEGDAPKGPAPESAAQPVGASATPRRTAAERRHDATTTLTGRPATPPPPQPSPAPTGRTNGAALHRTPDAPTPPRPPAAQSAASARKGDAKTAEAAPAAASGPAAAMVTGASLSADELCAASGLSPQELAGLKGFGLVECVMVAGIETYDEDALTVANLAAAFRAFGIEPRHLRLYRNAADRELGLIEQVVIPLLRQRNPESRQRAVDGADQLAALGQSMRATLLRQALRRHLGG